MGAAAGRFDVLQAFGTNLFERAKDASQFDWMSAQRALLLLVSLIETKDLPCRTIIWTSFLQASSIRVRSGRCRIDRQRMHASSLR
jgi:hypothetical protein